MKYCRFQSAAGAAFAVVENVNGRETITRAIAPPLFPAGAGRAPSSETLPTFDPIPLADARLLPPIAPSKIICIGRNYKAHAEELGNELPPEPLIFLKPPSALLAPGGTIVRPKISQRVDHEAELGIVIGKRCRMLRDDEPVEPYIHGYTCVNDVTARDLQKKDGQWTRGKGFDTFCPVGPVVVTDLDLAPGIGVEARVNGEVKQHGNTRDLIFSLDAVIRFIARVMTLEPGDLIATGTPAGVGPLAAGDVVEVTAQGIGTLRNPVADE
jgi:2-keto-4-pentenoate hydratase/2-oxohepta-3-ene-1,7-dioic acid hydratase in catechol pathway